MKYLKKFNESIEVEGFELSSDEQRNETRSIFNSLSFTDEECEEVDIVFNSYGFKVSRMLTTLEMKNIGSFRRYICGDIEIYLDKYEDDWYYVLHYEHLNVKPIIWKCSEFDGLINALHYIGKNYK